MLSPRRHLALALLSFFLGCSSSDPATDPGSAGAGGAAGASGAAGQGGDGQCPAVLKAATPRPTKRPAAGPLDDTLRVNHIQAKATHNSYHVEVDTNVPDWRYGEKPLDVQLDAEGVRGLELDVHWKEDCGRYEVYHLTFIDENTTCRVFTECLQKIRGWSDAHIGHHPIFLHIEPKDEWDADTGEARFTSLEQEILSVWPRESVITPDEVKGSSATLAAALTDHGWPTLGQTRGRILVYMDRSDAMRDAYTHGRKDLDGRLLFTDSDLDDPFAAIRIVNDATASDRIAAALARNQIVRITTEGTLAGALANTDTDAPVALASGAQILSTDFPAPVTDTPYTFTIADGTPSRCSPVTAPPGCTPAAIESPDLLATPP